LIDSFVIAVVFVFVMLAIVAIDLGQAGFDVESDAALSDGGAAAVLVVPPVLGVGWYGFQQGRTGRTAGRAVVGLRLISDKTGRPPGGGQGLLRMLVLAGMVLSGLGFILDLLWPVLRPHRQRFTDRWLGLSVVRD